jgi:hypothetical protein
MTKIDMRWRWNKDRAAHAACHFLVVSLVLAGSLVGSAAAQTPTAAPTAPASAGAPADGAGASASQTAPAAALVPAEGTAAAASPAAPTSSDPAPLADAAKAENAGYVIHQTADLGGHLVGVSGSGAMYNTLINIHSGPRVLGQTFSMLAMPGMKHSLMDSLTAFSNGFGGDPINVIKLDFSKAKDYEFRGIFRRDRQYFDYDLLGNPSIPPGLAIPYGMVNGVATTAALQTPQINQSPVLFNTVRRMTDIGLTLLPLSKVTFRIQYSQNIFQGPTLSPGRSILKYDLLLSEYQRNSTDDFLGAIDWKPLQQTVVTFEEQVNHYKGDSYFTLDPNRFNVQEANGLPGQIGNWYATAAPYTSSACNTLSMGAAYTNATNYTLLTAPATPGGLPIVNPACDVTTSYLRSQPTRTIVPTETVRVQSSSIPRMALNGAFGYTVANSTINSYYENVQGLDGVAATGVGVTPAYPAQAIRSATFTGNTYAQRRMVNGDLGITWNATKAITLSDQLNFSNLHQPGYADITPGITQNTTTNPNETINYAGPLGPGTNFTISGNPSGTPLYAYFGQKWLINNATLTWEASPKATLSLTYRYRAHTVIQTSGTGPLENLIGVDENGGILNIAYRPTSQWKMNGTVEILYDDNAFTPVEARQTKHFRFHTLYKPKPWATVSGAFNDYERHNNTNNTGTPSADGPLNHVDFNRTVAAGLALAPNEKYSFDVDYAFSDIYTATNICYFSGATAADPGTASINASGAPNLCPNTLTDWYARDFMSAPTQYASGGLTFTPSPKVRTAAGYRISAVSGNQFFAVAQQVNGSLQSAYQSPFFNIAWIVHPGWIWKAEYNYYGYGEGGTSGAPFCSNSTSTTAVVVPCNSSALVGPTGLKEPSSGLSAPRNMHANIVTLTMHYEF